MASLTQEQLTSVDSIFAGGSVPRYVWLPIALMESALNPLSSTVTSKESSHGLFQINTKANPQYAGKNLTDPSVNATIALHDFIKPAYTDALNKGLTNPGDIAAYVWQYGIKPDWSQVRMQGKDGQLMAIAANVAKNDSSGTLSLSSVENATKSVDTAHPVGGTDSGSSGSSGASWTEALAKTFSSDTWSRVLWVLIGLILLILGLVVAFRDEAVSTVRSVVGGEG